MLVSLEGPDKCGKSTLFHALSTKADAVLLRRNPYDPQLSAVISKLERMQEALVRQMHDPNRLYLSDRSFTLSPQVYSRFMQRPLLADVTSLRPHEFIIYLDVPVTVLCKRANGTEWFQESRYPELVALYEDVLHGYSYVRLDGEMETDLLVEAVLDVLAGVREVYSVTL